MKKYSDLEYLKLSKWERFKYRFVSFFASIPVAIWHAILDRESTRLNSSHAR